jgi:PAS domain S-box-containing protein
MSKISFISKKAFFIKVLLLLLLILGVRFYLEKEESEKIKRNLTFQQEQYVNVLYESINQTLLALDRMASRHLGTENYLFQLWKSDAENYYDHFQTFQAIEWANSETKIEWIYPTEGNESAIGLILNKEGRRDLALSYAKKYQKGAITKPLTLVQGGLGFLTIHPTFKDNQTSGYIVGVFKAKRILSKFVDENFYVDVSIDNESVFKQIKKEHHKKYFTKKTIPIRNTEWTFSVIPSTVVMEKSGRTYWIRHFVYFVVFLFGFLFLAYQHRNRSKEIELESDLIQSNQYRDLALEGAGLGIWDWYLKTNEVKFDRRWAEMLGLDVNAIDMELSTWEDRVHPEDLQSAYDDIKLYMDGKTDRYENIHRMKHADGHWVYILDRGRFSDFDDEGNPIRFTGTHMDVTARKEIARDLSLILENVAVGIWSYDPVSKVLSWDKSMFRIYELDPSDFDHSFESCLRNVDPEDRDRVEKEFNQSLMTDHQFDIKFKIKTKSGYKFIRAKAFVERDNAKKPILVNGVSIDVTKETRAINKANEQIKIAQHQAKLASLGELAAGVGHEINNPLTIIKGYIDTLKRRSKKEDSGVDHKFISYLEKIDEASTRIENIVGGLRTFSKSDDAEMDLFDPVIAIESCLNMTREIYSNQDIDINFNNKIEHKEILLYGSSGKFQQIIMNLIKNARDAVLKSSKKQIDIACNENHGHLEVIIKDTGKGIPKELHEKIFDPFFTTKDVNEGTGIGLSLAQNFIREMNGEITISSELNEGTQISLNFPINSTQEKVETSTSSDGGNLKGKVLIVDDESHILELLKIVLEDFGLDVVSAENGKEGLDLFLSEEKIDLIISDVKMPVMDGPSFLNAIKENDQKTKPKFIFMTGGVDLDLGKEFKNQIDGYIYKPFEDESIYDMIEKCLGE